MTEEIYIEEAGTEKDDICKGKIIVVFSGLTKRRRANLQSYVSGAIKAMKNNKPDISNLKNYKEKKEPEKETETRTPRIVRGPQVTKFLQNLNCQESEVVGFFNGKFPGNTSDPEKIVEQWRKLHPVLRDVHPNPPQQSSHIKPGDKVKYCKGEKNLWHPVGVVQEIGTKSSKKMLVRFGISDIQYVNIEDYEKVE